MKAQECSARSWGLSLQAKMFLVVASTILSAIICCGVWMHVLLSDVLASQTDARAKALSSYIATRSVDLYLTNDLLALSDLLEDAVSDNEDVVYAFIENDGGRVVVESGLGKTISRELIDQNFPQFTEDGYVENSIILNTDHGVVVDCAIPMFNDSPVAVRLGMGYGSADAALRSTMLQFGIFTCAIMGLAAAVAFVLVRSTLKNVKSLVALTEKVSAGGLDLRARLKSRDEIGKLAASFNAMLDDLQEAEANRDQYIEALASKEEALAMLLQRAIDSQEEERKRIARELHDETSHSLSAMLIELQNLRGDGNLSPSQVDRVRAIRGLIEQSLDDVNRLAWNLRPSVLDKFGLTTSLERYLEEIEERHGISASLTIQGDASSLPPNIEITVYRIAQEAVTNALKYADADELDVSLVINSSITLLVEDNGKGFDVDEVSKLEPGKHLGLLGMDERVSMFGGKLSIEAAVGAGTTIIARIPLRDTGSK